jgi:hypothetical protein
MMRANKSTEEKYPLLDSSASIKKCLVLSCEKKYPTPTCIDIRLCVESGFVFKATEPGSILNLCCN